jgi:hypothetical protein
MKTLQDAWDWYEAARENLARMNRLGTHHWDDDSLVNSSISKDERFKELLAAEIVAETKRAITPLNDLGVLVLFSVFEAAVRAHLESLIEPLTATLGHPILQNAANGVLEGIRQGSFANEVLSPLQKQGEITSELSDKAKQVRNYRNWMAHGKRVPRPSNIINLTPKETFERLKEFLDTLGFAVEAELPEAVESGDDSIGQAPE